MRRPGSVSLLLTTMALLATSAMGATPEEIADLVDFCEDFDGANVLGEITSKVNNSKVDKGLNKLLEFSSDKSFALGSLFGDRKNLILKELRKSPEEGEKFQVEYLQEYGQSLVPFGGPGIVLFVLSILMCPCCFFCSKRCCFKNAKESKEYNVVQKTAPVIFYFMFSLIATVLAVVSINNISGFANGSVGSLCEMDNLALGLDTFFDELVTPIKRLVDTSNTVIDNIETMLDQTTDIDQSFEEMKTALEDLHDYLETVPLPTPVPADSLDDIANKVGDALLTIQDNAVPTIDILVETREGARNDLISGRDTVNDASKDGLAQIENSMSFKEDLKSFITDGKLGVKSSIGMLTSVSFGFFSTVFLAFFAALFVMLALVTPCKLDDKIAKPLLNLSWFCTYFFMMFLFLLSGIFIPVTFVFTDTCEVLELAPSNMEEFFGSMVTLEEEDAAVVTRLRRALQSEDIDPFGLIEGCFANPPVPLMQQLNITGSIDVSVFTSFTDDLPDLDVSLNFTVLEDLKTEVDAMTPEDFGLDLDEVIGFLSDYTSATDGNLYTLVDCTPTTACDATCRKDGTSPSNPCAPSSDNPVGQGSDLDDLRTNVVDAIVAHGKLDEIFGTMSTMIAPILAKADEFANATRVFAENVEKAVTLFDPLLDDLDKLSLAGDCGFVGNFYWDMHESVCTDTLGPLGQLSLNLFMIGVCAIPILITGLYINFRLLSNNRGDATVWADEA